MTPNIESPMLLSEFVQRLRTEMTAQEITTPEERAFFLATAHQECAQGEGDRRTITRLAQVWHNPWGIKWTDGEDNTRYSRIRLRGNQFDKSKYVDYRIYHSLHHALEIERINKFLRPKVYAECKQKFGGTYPKIGLRPNWEKWIACIAKIHCPDNQKHVEQVLTLWQIYFAEELSNG